MERGQTLGDGFQLLIGLAEIHVPRMWVERHVSKPDSQVSGKCSEFNFLRLFSCIFTKFRPPGCGLHGEKFPFSLLSWVGSDIRLL